MFLTETKFLTISVGLQSWIDHVEIVPLVRSDTLLAGGTSIIQIHSFIGHSEPFYVIIYHEKQSSSTFVANCEAEAIHLPLNTCKQFCFLSKFANSFLSKQIWYLHTS